MLSDDAVKELLEYDAPHPVLSVYLNVHPERQSTEADKLRLRGLLKDAARDRKDVDDDVAAVEHYFGHQYDGSGRTLALFSSAAAGFFRAYSLQVPMRSRARVMPHPYVKPLADALDAYGHYGVAVVDQQGARLFDFHLGELREQSGILGESVKHTKRGGASTVPGRMGGTAGRTRHEEEKVTRNMRDAAEFAVGFWQQNGSRRILLGGTDDALTQFRSALPKAWQERVMGTFSIEMGAGHADVLDKAMQVAVAVERQREAKLVEQMITAAAKGGPGVIRLDDTLGAVHEGRVQTLLVHAGYRAPGRCCRNCRYVTSQALEVCPFCGGSFEAIEDAVEEAVRRVMADGGDVQVVHDNPRLQQAGRIGGVLRY